MSTYDTSLSLNMEKPSPAAGRRLRRPNSQNSNYARRFSQGFSYPYNDIISYHVGCGDMFIPGNEECSRVLDKN